MVLSQLESYATPPQLVTAEEGGYPSSDVTHAHVDSFLTVLPYETFFGRRHLTEVELPAGLRVIGEKAFWSCSSLSTIKFPPTPPSSISSSLETIGDEAFVGCGMPSLVLPEGLRFIGVSAFHHCKELRTLRIPSTVDVIRQCAFFLCLSLTHVFLSEGVKVIGSQAFSRCDELPKIAIPSTVSSIGYLAFGGCRSLRSVELPRVMLHLAGGAFHDCQLLSNIVVPTLVGLANSSADGPIFSYCHRLAECFHGSADAEYPQSDLLRDRFSKVPLPIHEICYFQRQTDTSATVRQELLQYLELEKVPVIGVDSCGMTPFHVLALSADGSPGRVDLFRTLLEHTPWDLLLKRDVWGNRPLHYMCLRTNYPGDDFLAADQELIKEVFQRTVVDRLNVLGLEKWKTELQTEIAFMEHSAWLWGESDCTNEIDLIHRKFEVFEQMDKVALLELALWKMKLDEMKNDKLEGHHPAAKKQKIDASTSVPAFPDLTLERVACRVNCGANVVLSNVLPFLGPVTWDDVDYDDDDDS
eukprot:scaffold2939_cov123-Cylindrotheca_fusiformis.AAC.2